MGENENLQILKSREDRAPILLADGPTTASGGKTFKLYGSTEPSWAKGAEVINSSVLRPRIEPWLTALLQSEHVSLLIGSGLTHAIYRMATGAGLQGMNQASFSHFATEIDAESRRTAEAAGRAAGNVEDQIRVANELLRGLEILALNNEEVSTKAKHLQEDLTKIMREFADSILLGEQGIVSAPPDARAEAFGYLVSFLMSFASRTGTRDRLQIFTTNYDRLIEAGAEAAGLHLLDRFVGSVSPIFRASRLDLDLHYNPPGIRGEPRFLEGVARFSKLHGSLDWVNTDNSIRRTGVPFGATDLAPYLSMVAGSDARNLMIYPNSAKDRETSAYPYVDLFRDFAAATCRPNSVLVCFGYSFGDEHINRVVEDMLTIPSTHLVVISFSDPLERIINMYERLGRHAQTTLLIGNHLGDFRSLVNEYLPKPAIDRTSIRMAELLRARWGVGPTNSTPDAPALGEGTASS